MKPFILKLLVIQKVTWKVIYSIEESEIVSLRHSFKKIPLAIEEVKYHCYVILYSGIIEVVLKECNKTNLNKIIFRSQLYVRMFQKIKIHEGLRFKDCQLQ